MAEHVTGHAASSNKTADPSVNSRTLFNGHKTIAIDHNGQRYSLRITSSGKLILTK